MNKRLRRRIKELCEIEGLDKESKIQRAQEILQDNKFKQRLCNQMPGLSFRDIDKVIGGLVKETEFEKEQRELQEVAPQKLNPDHYFKEFTPKNTHNPNDTYSLEEMAALTKASEKPVQSKEVVDENRYYDTYTFEEIAALIAGNYYPEMFKRKRKRRKKG